MVKFATAHILIVEDDDVLRENLKTILGEESLGYRISTAKTHQDADDFLKLHARGVSLILSDTDIRAVGQEERYSGIRFVQEGRNKGIPTIIWSNEPNFHPGEIGQIASYDKGYFGISGSEPYISLQNKDMFLQAIREALSQKHASSLV